MKISIFGLVLISTFLCLGANATGPDDLEFSPALQQTAKYEGTQEYKTAEKDYWIYGANSRGWLVHWNFQTAGYADSNTLIKKDLWSSENYKAKMLSCESEGGVIETISVKAGTFRTCRYDSHGWRIWQGNVPVFGIVKKAALLGGSEMELTSYRIE